MRTGTATVRRLALLVALGGSATGALAAQEGGGGEPLTLEEALALARRENVDLAVRERETRMARAEVREARAALLPRLDVGAGYTRSVDPVNAFGTKLQQGVFGEPDFGLRRLNDPDDIGNWSVRTEASWSLLDPTRLAAHDASRHRAEAAAWTEIRQREATDFRTRSLYFRAAGAREERRAAETALEAARTTRNVLERRYGEGMVTRAELLRGEAEVEAAVAFLEVARAREREARERLGLHLGMDGAVPPVPVDSLVPPGVVPGADPPPPTASDPPADRSPYFGEGEPVESGVPARADLRARREAVEAAEAERRRAVHGYLPALEAFGIVKSHDPDFGGMDAGDWTVGLSLRWNAFEGLGREARADRARARTEAARLDYEQAVREARSERRRARTRLEAARRSVEALEAARRAASEGRDLLRRRFEEGMATASELLRAEARLAEIEARRATALADYHVAAAWLRFVRGGDATGGAP